VDSSSSIAWNVLESKFNCSVGFADATVNTGWTALATQTLHKALIGCNDSVGEAEATGDLAVRLYTDQSTDATGDGINDSMTRQRQLEATALWEVASIKTEDGTARVANAIPLS